MVKDKELESLELYTEKPELLILDEATSALDNVTEQLVMNEIFKLKKNDSNNYCSSFKHYKKM